MKQTSSAPLSPLVDEPATFARIASFRRANVEELDRIEAREIGFDFARRGMKLPEDCGVAFREGWLEARARFGNRVDIGTHWERKLLRLRLSAWRRSRIVDKLVTADYLEHISVSICPITREALTTGTHGLSDATVDRVFNDGAYAVGNLAVMSQRANLAKANRSIDEIFDIARRLRGDERHEGLNRLEWARLASLCCQALPRECGWHAWPLLVWPPNGLMVSNGLGMLMMAMSLLVLGHFRPAVLASTRSLCGTKQAKKAFDAYVAAHRTRLAVLSRGVRSLPCAFHPLEDSWLSELVWRRFLDFVKATPSESLAAVGLAHHRAMGRMRKPMTEEHFRGWAMESRGYLTQRRDDFWASAEPCGRTASRAQ